MDWPCDFSSWDRHGRRSLYFVHLAIFCYVDKLVNLLIVGVTGANRLLENGGVGGDATDAVLVQQTLELAGNEL